jgi:ABC-type nickel/cobalt efflux system permease component RcnA
MGLLLGIKHATEADHLAAVATLVTREQSLGRAVKQGIAWGIGHTLTLSIFGGLVLAAGSSISEPLARWLELAVGIMLIALGVDVVRRLRRQRTHFHVHAHDNGVRHVHLHSHAGDGDHAASPHHHSHPSKLPLRATLVGMMHGMAGSAALVLLSVEAVTSPLLGWFYIATFGVGSIAGMAMLSAVIALPLRFSASRLTRLHGALMNAIGAASCGLGLLIVYRQVLV